jgi:hypothetical protein
MIGRVSRPLNRGSSQMNGLSGGTVRSSTCRGASPRASHRVRFSPARPLRLERPDDVPLRVGDRELHRAVRFQAVEEFRAPVAREPETRARLI